MNEDIGFHRTRQNVHEIIRGCRHPVHEGIADLDGTPDGLSNLEHRTRRRNVW